MSKGMYSCMQSCSLRVAGKSGCEAIGTDVLFGE